MEKFYIPEELLDIFDEAEAARKARADAAKCYFKFQLRNAIELGKIHERKKRQFWITLKKLYPEINPAKVTIDIADGTCWEVE